MIQYRINCEHDAKSWKKSWNRRIVDESSGNKGAYANRNCYYGTISNDELMVYYHSEGSNDHLVTRFYGTVKPEENGCCITGEFRKKKSAFYFLGFMIVMMAACLAAFLMNGMYVQCLMPVVLIAVASALFAVTPKASVQRLSRLLAEITNECGEAAAASSDEAEADAETH